MKLKNIFLFLFFLFINKCHTSNFEYVRIKKDPYINNLVGRVAKVEFEVENILIVDEDPKSILIKRNYFLVESENSVIQTYYQRQDKKLGISFYLKISGRPYCFHESWLERISKDEFEKEILENSSC